MLGHWESHPYSVACLTFLFPSASWPIQSCQPSRARKGDSSAHLPGLWLLGVRQSQRVERPMLADAGALVL